jgi:hypothetical protein
LEDVVALGLLVQLGFRGRSRAMIITSIRTPNIETLLLFISAVDGFALSWIRISLSSNVAEKRYRSVYAFAGL